ncbi:MAG: 3-isopropylmalate dehydratase small subunit [Myxococcales bacterium]|nr:MAG: 3-isopropylmalate dehydratase small subunit [Myxococcales bacterium]
MASFTTLTSHAALLSAENVDTDQIIPARFLKTLDKNGLGKQLFFDWRYLPDGSDNPDFVLNRPEAQGAQILVAGDNFGCGSSREHAPWSLMGWGLRAVISTSFADIFKGNSLKNGLLPIVVDAPTHAKIVAALKQNPQAELKVDLAKTELTLPGGEAVKFPIDAFAQHCLLNGIDQLGYILSHDDKIKAYEAAQP